MSPSERPQRGPEEGASSALPPSGSGRRGNSIRGALSLTFIQRAVGIVFTFGSVTLISRLLTPAEIGVFSVAVGFMALVHMLRDFGVTDFLIQEKEVDDARIRTVFTINMLIAWSLGLVVFFSSGVVGRFYGQPGVTQVLRVMSMVFVLFPFGTTTQALLRRDMQFGKLFRIRVSASVTRSCLSVGLAWAGFSYMSMAWSSLAGMLVTILGCLVWGWEYRARGVGLTHWRRVLHFGTFQTVSDIAKTLGAQAPNLVIGRVLGMAPTAFYSRGYGVVNLYRTNVIGAISAVAFPAFARKHRDEGTAPELFRKSLVYLTGISWPFFAVGVLLARPIILVLFGGQWDAAVPLMRWLCAAAFIGTLTYQCNQFLVALGKVRLASSIRVRYEALRVGLAIMAAFYSLQAVAASQILVYVAAAFLYYRNLHRYETLRPANVMAALVPSAILAAGTIVVPAVVVLWPGFVDAHMVTALVVGVVGGCTGWVLTLACIKHPLRSEVQHVIARLGLRFSVFQRSRVH